MAGDETCFLTGAARPRAFPAARGPEVVFAGRSNVGKSSLLNAVSRRRKLARVSRTPGRTQQVNFYAAAGMGTLVDFPGYGFAHAPAEVRMEWKPLVESYLQDDRPVVLCLLLVDARHEPTPQDHRMMEWLRELERPFRVVLSKADAVPSSRMESVIRRAAVFLEIAPGAGAPLPVSARTGMGIPGLRTIIHRAVQA
ncbi:MAG: ribosome biogenesis GTP-binding protein YihA/YsxC [Acidobacteriota bacterium]